MARQLARGDEVGRLLQAKQLLVDVVALAAVNLVRVQRALLLVAQRLAEERAGKREGRVLRRGGVGGGGGGGAEAVAQAEAKE